MIQKTLFSISLFSLAFTFFLGLSNISELDSRPGGGGSYRSGGGGGSSSRSSGSSGSGGGGNGDAWTMALMASGLGGFLSTRKEIWEMVTEKDFPILRYAVSGIFCLLAAFSSSGSPTSSALYLAICTVFPFVVFYFAVYDLFKPRNEIFVAKASSNTKAKR